MMKIHFFGPEMTLTSLVAISGPKKFLIFRAHPFLWPSKCTCPRHINNRYISSFTMADLWRQRRGWGRRWCRWPFWGSWRCGPSRWGPPGTRGWTGTQCPRNPRSSSGSQCQQQINPVYKKIQCVLSLPVTCLRFSTREYRWDLAEWLERLTVNAKVASIQACSDVVESEGRQMKQCWITCIKRRRKRILPKRFPTCCWKKPSSYCKHGIKIRKKCTPLFSCRWNGLHP